MSTWLALAVVGAIAAPKATSSLSYEFGLPGQPGYETNRAIADTFKNGGENAPVLVIVGDGKRAMTPGAAKPIAATLRQALPGSRIASFDDQPDLLSKDKATGVVLVYPQPVPGPEPYAAALPTVEKVSEQLSQRTGMPIEVTGQDALAAESGGGADVLVETLFGGIGALVVLVVVFGSFLALTPLLVAAVSILTTFLIVFGLTRITDISFIVQYLLALIGLGVAIDYALLIVTRWREERDRATSNAQAIGRTMATAGRSVLFSGITVAISLAALIALPVPFLRSVGFTGLLIPIISVIASLTLLPAVLLVVGPRLAWPNRRTGNPESKAWRSLGVRILKRRWLAAAVASLILLALALPLTNLRLGQATNESLASIGGSSATAVTQLDNSGVGDGLTQPLEIITTNPQSVQSALGKIDGIAGTIAPESWRQGNETIMTAWTSVDASSEAGLAITEQARAAAEHVGARVGGIPAQNSDFIHAVYGNAWWIVGAIVLVTFLLLAVALRSIVLPLKALLLNVISIAAAYGITVLIWQDGFATEALFNQSASGAITVWVPIAVFAFLFGLSMDYEVFLLSRIREGYEKGMTTDRATVYGMSRTGRLITSGALILFLAFISLSRVPATDVKILATALALGIIIDATIVRGVLAPALVAGFGSANWWWPFGSHNDKAQTD